MKTYKITYPSTYTDNGKVKPCTAGAIFKAKNIFAALSKAKRQLIGIHETDNLTIELI